MGTASYFGDYNARFLGSSVDLGNGEEPNSKSGTGDLTFGFNLEYPITEKISALGGVTAGALEFSDAENDIFMNTQFSHFGLGAKYNFSPFALIQPYVSGGVHLLRFKLPESPTNLNLVEFASGNLGERKTGFAFPLSFGLHFEVSEKTRFFAEANFTFTSTDDLDNLSPSSEVSQTISNDAYSSFRVGMNFAVFKFFEFERDQTLPSRGPELIPYADIAVLANPEAVKPLDVVNPDSAKRILDEMLQDSVHAAQAEISKERRPQEKEYSPAEVSPKAEPKPAPIAVVDTTDRNFDRKKELERLLEIQEERRRQAEKRGEDLPDLDPYIPVIVFKPKPLSEDILIDGFVTKDPPEGYYVQVYATVGPITAQRNRRRTMDILKDVLESAERQVIITQRGRFFEVRIGVFDTYDDTIQVLEMVKGTYLDAYTLIFLSNE